MNTIKAANADALMDSETGRLVNDLAAFGEGGPPIVRSGSTWRHY